MSSKIFVAIVGISGYTGIEALRLLLLHDMVEIKALCANANAGKNVAEIYPSFEQYDLPVIQKIEDVDFRLIDCAFFCLPHGASQEVILDVYQKYPNVKIIDLSADFRLKSADEHKKWYGVERLNSYVQQEDSVYGLPELCDKNLIKTRRIIACPGCYPTSILLALKPLLLARALELENIIIDSKSGISGAGRKELVSSLFGEVEQNTRAYNLFSHRHNSEISQELGFDVDFVFTPHIVPQTRGILSTIYTRSDKSEIELFDILKNFYKDSKFVIVSANLPQTKDVIGTNFCKISLKKKDSKLIIVSAIDNLTKGSSGQAVQCMNIAFGFKEDYALKIAPSFP